ncbi:MAG: PaaI family thioesterase [Syntrophales bacterium]|nr:PaaI family thioesterase [Syntrophales bacterium]
MAKCRGRMDAQERPNRRKSAQGCTRQAGGGGRPFDTPTERGRLNSMKTRNPHYRDQVRAIFDKAPFITDLGLVLSDLGPGWCESVLTVLPKHLQQDGFVHAGVQATVADHTAGGAAGTLVGSNEMVLTAEFKINLLRPALGERLRCRATVLKSGKTLIVAESEVYAVRDGKEKLAAKATVTLAPVEKGK